MASCCINVRLSIRDTDPGGECEICGEDTYLGAAEAILVLSPGKFLPVGHLCQSCASIIHDRCAES